MHTLLAFMMLSTAIQDEPKEELSPSSSLRYVEVTTEASATSERGIQIVTVRMKFLQSQRIAGRPHPILGIVPSYLKLIVATGDPKTKIGVIYPRGRTINDGAESRVEYDDEIAIQAVIQRAEGDRSPVEGRLDFRVMGTFF